MSNSTPRTAPRDAPPAAEGVRIGWHEVAPWIRQAVEADLGGIVVGAAGQVGGFSPGAAVRLTLDDGRRAFVKAVSAGQNPESPGMYRDEARNAAALPPRVPAPRLLATYDDGHWVALLFEDVEGRHPRTPWRQGELDRVLRGIEELSAALTPSPAAVPSAGERLAGAFRGWRTLAAEYARGENGLDGLAPWARERLAALADREAGWAAAAEGGTLVHADLRADNILLTADRVVFVDWPHACLAAPWFDLLLMLPSVAMQGLPGTAPLPEALFTTHPTARDADPDAVTTVLAALAGMLLERARHPAPPGAADAAAVPAGPGNGGAGVAAA